MADLSRLKTRTCNKIRTIEILLTTMTKPALDLTQKHERDGNIRKIDILTLEAHLDLLEIEDKYKDNIDARGYQQLLGLHSQH